MATTNDLMGFYIWVDDWCLYSIHPKPKNKILFRSGKMHYLNLNAGIECWHISSFIRRLYRYFRGDILGTYIFVGAHASISCQPKKKKREHMCCGVRLHNTITHTRILSTVGDGFFHSWYARISWYMILFFFRFEVYASVINVYKIKQKCCALS